MRFLILVSLLILAGWFAYTMFKAMSVRNNAKARWEVKQKDIRGQTEVWLVKGSEQDLIGSIQRMSDDYNELVLEARSKAQEQQLQRNALLDSATQKQLEH